MPKQFYVKRLFLDDPLAQKLEIHHTPKHGSWLNMAELELSVLARQCLEERMESQDSEAATRRLAAGAQRYPPARGLALHDRRRKDQTPTSLPRNPTLNKQ
jgi:DDE superfamily endonuclease